MLKTAANLANLGTETAFDVLARAARLDAARRADGRSPVINLGIGQPDFPTPDHVVEAAVKALRDGHHGYTPAQGVPALREAVAADLHARHGVEVDPGRVVVVPGGKPTMFFAMLMFGEPGAEILYPDPGFPIYRSAIEFTGAKAVPIPLREENAFAFSASDVIERMTERTRLVIVNSPANPTGGVTPPEEMDKLAEALAERPDVAVLSDEIYSTMLYDGREHRSILQYPELAGQAIMLDGWSKRYAMTGWRLGYAVWPEALVERAVRLCVNDHSCVNAPTQYAGIAALEGPQDAAEAMVQAFDERRRVTVDRLNALPGVRCVEPGGAFYAFPNIEGTGLESRGLQDRLLEEAGVAAIAGPSFGLFGEGYLRISYANSTQNIEEAMDRMAALLS
ncbi:MAG: pyridoxal phosphate-dependent aminotransferase [Marivibrio sp.]|uniref:pyridoxal phosphate-dependent aminotransferase n=1 Tax=Marivibrio sp. TaxID=2039719 RepID=UPI0032EEE80F